MDDRRAVEVDEVVEEEAFEDGNNGNGRPVIELDGGADAALAAV